MIDGQDAAPTPAMRKAYEEHCKELTTAVANWNAMMETDLANLNGELAKAGLSPAGAATLPNAGVSVERRHA